MSSITSDLALLDNPEERATFSRVVSHADARVTTWASSVVIDGMHCSACALNVEHAVKNVPGVVSADVNATSHRAQIVWQEDFTRPSQWMQAITDAGYGVVPALDTTRRERRLSETRAALWRWLVAELCMMQVMMYAWPEYAALSGEMTIEMRHLMRWASWVLTLPVLLFSCKPFFTNAWLDVRHSRISMDLPVAIGIAITFMVSTVGTFEPTGLWGKEVYFDSLTMFVFFLLTGRWLELRLRDRTAGALEALINRMPDSALRQLPSGEYERVLVRQLKPQDLVRVSMGEAFPADGLIVEGSTHVDEALLTGESKPIVKGLSNTVIAGSHNLESPVLIRIETVGAQTRFAQIVQLMEQASLQKPQWAQLADRLAKPFLWCILGIAGWVAVYGWAHDPSQAVMTAVTVLIVTCPCALSLATPAAMLAAAGALSQKGILIKRLQALESLAKIDTLIFDKTGTLTEDGLVLCQLETRADVTKEFALQVAQVLAKDSLHPIARAVMAAKTASGFEATSLGSFQMLSKKEYPGQGIESCLQAASGLKNTYRLGSAKFCATQSLQTVSVQTHLSDEKGWLASFELQEKLRSDAQQTITLLRQAGIDVQLLSGDSALATKQLAEQLHISKAEGSCTPDLKLHVVKRLQAQGHWVAMVGDGLNDGPVLAGAHVSFAFGRAVPLTQSKADFLILGEQLQHIALTVFHARRTMRVVKQNLSWALVYNAAAIPLAIGGYLPAWLAGLGMAGSSLLVVGNAYRLRKLSI